MLRGGLARQALSYGGRVERLPGEDQRLLVVAERRAVVLTASLALRRAVVRMPRVADRPVSQRAAGDTEGERSRGGQRDDEPLRPGHAASHASPFGLFACRNLHRTADEIVGHLYDLAWPVRHPLRRNAVRDLEAIAELSQG